MSHKSMRFQRLSEHLDVWSWAAVCLMLLVLVGRYRGFNLDDIWFLSFSHGWSVEHHLTDGFMLEAFPSGMGGVIVFGKLPAALQSAFLAIFGWRLAAALFLSVAMIAGALWLMRLALRNWGYSSSFIAAFLLLTGFSESVVAAAEQSRYEFSGFFLLSAALWALSKNWYVAAGFFAAVAVETEPVAIVIPVAIAAFIITRGSRAGLRTVLPKLTVGIALAFGVYICLHPNFVDVFRSASWHDATRAKVTGGFVAAYFITSKRHLFDLLLVLIALLRVMLQRRWNVLRSAPVVALLAIVVVSALLGWGNVPYFCFVVPFLAMFLLEAFDTSRLRLVVVSLTLLFWGAQYAYRTYFWTIKHPEFSAAEELQVKSLIDEAAAKSGIYPGDAVVAGHYALWFAHPSRFINLDKRTIATPSVQDADLWLCTTTRLDPVLSVESSTEVPCDELTNRGLLLAARKMHKTEVDVYGPPQNHSVLK